MIVVVFDDENRANQGVGALKKLDDDGSISVHAAGVIMKNSDGSIDAKDLSDDYPVRTLTGTSIGALIGVLGGPIGVGVGASVGMLAGWTADLDRAGVNADFLEDVAAKLTPGKWAVVSDVSEEYETPVDNAMSDLGGTVFRANRVSVEDEQEKEEEAAMNVEIAQLKEEQAQASGSNKEKIQAKISSLNAKLQLKKQKAKQSSDQRKLELQAKMHGLEEKSKKSRADAKKKIDARIASARDWLQQPA
jgi:uncharacterized membrane protein